MAAPLHADSGSAPIGSFLRPRNKLRLWVMSDIHLELTRGWDLPTPEQRPDSTCWSSQATWSRAPNAA
ncbi:hypothetical protein ABIF99_002227 [Bradyrhizobium japonicum]|nr:hypothetical protein [Bradyrhizobium japonicum]MCW2327690.1 hypothetical protein [Bradyrhizobium japonicum]